MNIEFGPGTKIIKDDDPNVINRRSDEAQVGVEASRIEGNVKISGLFDHEPGEKQPEASDGRNNEGVYDPENYAAPKETLEDLGDTAATGLGAPPHNPAEGLRAVLAAIETDNSGPHDTDGTSEAYNHPHTTVNIASDHDRIAIQGNVYPSPERSEFPSGEHDSESQRTDTLEKLRAALRRMEEEGDNSPDVR